MKIKIEHIPNTYNYGSCMMAVNLISEIVKKHKDAKIYVDASTDEDLHRLRYETNYQNIISYNISGKKGFVNKCINKVDRKIKRIEADKIENIIVIGGDDISEYYGIESLENELKRIEENSKSKNIILLGQTIGPFTGDRGEKSRKALQNTKIYTRDDNTMKYLEKLKYKNMVRGRDLAFLPLPMQNAAHKILDKYNLKSEEYITIVPSGLTKCYTENYSDYIREQKEIVNKLLQNERLNNKKIVFLPHVLIPEHVDDRLIIREIIKDLNEEQRESVVGIDNDMMPSEAREILANGVFTITGRMHAAVSTFFMRKPAISLSYSVKYAGVIGDGLDMKELVIESKGDDIWKGEKISLSVMDKVNYVLDNYDSLIQKINKNVSETVEIVQSEIDDLIKGL